MLFFSFFTGNITWGGFLQQQPLKQLECEETGSQRNIFKYTFWFSMYLIKDHLLSIVTTDVYWYLESCNLHCILLCTQRFQGGNQAPVLRGLNELRLKLFPCLSLLVVQEGMEE